MSKLLDYLLAEDIRREISQAESRVINYASEDIFRKHFSKRSEFWGLFQSSTLPNIMSIFSIGSLVYSISREDFLVGVPGSLLAIWTIDSLRRVCKKSIIHKLEEAESNICYKHYKSDKDYDSI